MGDDKNQEESLGLRHAFVAMLFALTAGQIAISTADLYVIWKHADELPPTFYAPVAHLFLALLIVLTSWVGWSVKSLKKQSVATPKPKPPEESEEPERLKHPFGWPFIVLLIDVLLVVTYFVIVREVEITEVYQGQPAIAGQPVGEYSVMKQIGDVSALGEARLVVFMFFLYFLWDVVHDKIMRKFPLRVAAFASVVSLIAASSVLFALWRWRSDSPTVLSVVCGDLALVGVVMGFRALKGSEKPLAEMLKVQSAPHTFKKRDFTWGWWLALSIIVFVGGLAGMLVT